MISEEHQRLVNSLAKVLEDKVGVQITKVDIADTPHCFNQKYQNLPKPTEFDGRIPDLMGTDASGTIHLGEAETDMEAENLNEQLKAFSNLEMKVAKTSVPLHVIVPRRIRSQMESRIHNIGLGNKLGGRGITAWHV